MLVKVLNDAMMHFNFKYEFGLNILEGELNTDSSMPVGSGGLYYCDIKHLNSHVYRGNFVCVVEIPQDAVVVELNYIEEQYFRTNKLVLTNKIYRFDNNDDVLQLIALNPNLRDYLNDPQFITLTRTVV